MYNNATCPLDEFELLLFDVADGGKSFSFCPYCFNYPTLPGMNKGKTSF
jgi:DNA topoisomerase-3